jgi:hypothetical protein
MENNCIRLRRKLDAVEPANQDFVANRIRDYGRYQQLIASFKRKEDGSITFERFAVLQELYKTQDYKVKLETSEPKGVPDTIRGHIAKIITESGGYTAGDKIKIECRISIYKPEGSR